MNDDDWERISRRIERSRQNDWDKHDDGFSNMFTQIDHDRMLEEYQEERKKAKAKKKQAKKRHNLLVIENEELRKENLELKARIEELNKWKEI